MIAIIIIAKLTLPFKYHFITILFIIINNVQIPLPLLTILNLKKFFHFIHVKILKHLESFYFSILLFFYENPCSNITIIS